MSYMRTIARKVARTRMTGVYQNVNKQMDKVDKNGNKYWRSFTDGKYQNDNGQSIIAGMATKKKFRFKKCRAKT